MGCRREIKNDGESLYSKIAPADEHILEVAISSLGSEKSTVFDSPSDIQAWVDLFSKADAAPLSDSKKTFDKFIKIRLSGDKVISLDYFSDGSLNLKNKYWYILKRDFLINGYNSPILKIDTQNIE